MVSAARQLIEIRRQDDAAAAFEKQLLRHAIAGMQLAGLCGLRIVLMQEHGKTWAKRPCLRRNLGIAVKPKRYRFPILDSWRVLRKDVALALHHQHLGDAVASQLNQLEVAMLGHCHGGSTCSRYGEVVRVLVRQSLPEGEDSLGHQPARGVYDEIMAAAPLTDSLLNRSPWPVISNSIGSG